jgi:hypothetical protein
MIYPSGADRAQADERMSARSPPLTGVDKMRKRLVKLALTLGTMAAALLSGAAHLKIG